MYFSEVRVSCGQRAYIGSKDHSAFMQIEVQSVTFHIPSPK